MRVALDGESDRIEAAFRRDLAVAWHAAAFTRAKRLPNLDKITTKPKPKAKGIDEGHIRAAFDVIIKKQKRRKGADAKNRQPVR